MHGGRRTEALESLAGKAAAKIPVGKGRGSSCKVGRGGVVCMMGLFVRPLAGRGSGRVLGKYWASKVIEV